MQFITYGIGETAADALRDATWRAQEDDAANTGPAEKTDYVVISDEPQPWAAAKRLAKELLLNEDERISDKWGPAGMIAITEKSDLRETIWMVFGWAAE